jgi:hypothetical protein
MDENESPVPPLQTVQLPEKPPSWPTVFGVVGIILASLGLLNGCCGLGSPFLMDWFASFLEGQEGVREQDLRAMRASVPPTLWIVPASLVGIMLSVILMIGAIRLIQRRSSGVGLCKFWAWFTIPWSLVGFIVGVYFQMQVPTDAQRMGAAGQYLGLAFGGCMVLVLGVGLPLFALFWFMREPVRAEIQVWAEERRGVI